VADHNDHEIGREIVRALRGEVLAADLAMISHFKEAAEQVAAPAVRALHGEAAQHRLWQGNHLGHRSRPWSLSLT